MIMQDIRFSTVKRERMNRDKREAVGVPSIPMLPSVGLVLLVVAAVTAEIDPFKRSYFSLLEKKCNLLRMRYPAAFIGDRCFAATNEKYSSSQNDYVTLHKHCKHLSGYPARMALVCHEEQITILTDNEVLESNQRYYIGAHQTPTDVEADVACCKNPRHKEHWKYFDQTGKTVGDVKSSLWLKDQPDNNGEPPEFVVALESLNTSHKLGFNDANPKIPLAILCEYEDYLKCPKDFVLIGSDCYGIIDEDKNYDDADNYCRNVKGMVNGRLAVIEEDAVNQKLAELAFDKIKRRGDRGEQSHLPLMFGLKFSSDKKDWKYSKDDPVHFYRWYPKAAASVATNEVALLNAYPTGANVEPRYTYWTVGGAGGRYPFICMGNPDVANV